ncbi:hypothetical protein E2C01_068281 [Portunus trituberculatus]|uniref:Uncharacterized protein n=1 Tax=Portunus trituberculatus TaxID=210409 RepID=A0A5B7HYZ9_PORTR|nr:hypothetical protein [Portunus trituberculatus]
MFELHARFLESDGEWKYLASFSTCSVVTSSVYLGVTKLFSHSELRATLGNPSDLPCRKHPDKSEGTASEPDYRDFEEETEENEDSSSEDSENDSEDPPVFPEQREDRDSGDGEQTPNIVLRTQSGSRRHRRKDSIKERLESLAFNITKK